MKTTIVYPYRNRNLERVKRSLDSLTLQAHLDFKVLFIDYGSEENLAKQIEKLVQNYSFVEYHYLCARDQPWNKSKAINYALQLATTTYFFVADIDIIFRSDFFQKAFQFLITSKSNNVYFKVGFLSESETKRVKDFEDYSVVFESNSEATGLTLFTTSVLKSIGGFDEFYHFWGAEDTDLHLRLRNANYSVSFYEDEMLLVHQWHKSYRSLEQKRLTQDLQLTNVVQLNHHYLKEVAKAKRTTIRFFDKEYSIYNQEIKKLQEEPVTIELNNSIEAVNHFLFIQLPNLNKGLVKVKFEEDSLKKTIKYYFKLILGKKVPKYYTLKEINDSLLLHIISFYHHFPYVYQVSPDLKSIIFAIKK